MMKDIEESVLFKTLCENEDVMNAITKDQLLLELGTAKANYREDSFNEDEHELIEAFTWDFTPQGGDYWSRLSTIQLYGH
jgi:hypothetical protein